MRIIRKVYIMPAKPVTIEDIRKDHYPIRAYDDMNDAWWDCSSTGPVCSRVAASTHAEFEEHCQQMLAAANEPNLTLLKVNMNEETTTMLTELAAFRNISYTEAIRRAIAVYKFVEDEALLNHTIRSVDANGNTVTTLQLL